MLFLENVWCVCVCVYVWVKSLGLKASYLGSFWCNTSTESTRSSSGLTNTLTKERLHTEPHFHQSTMKAVSTRTALKIICSAQIHLMQAWLTHRLSEVDHVGFHGAWKPPVCVWARVCSRKTHKTKSPKTEMLYGVTQWRRQLWWPGGSPALCQTESASHGRPGWRSRSSRCWSRPRTSTCGWDPLPNPLDWPDLHSNPKANLSLFKTTTGIVR